MINVSKNGYTVCTCTPCFDTETMMCLSFTFHIMAYYTVGDTIARYELRILHMYAHHTVLFTLFNDFCCYIVWTFGFTQTNVLRIPSIFRPLQRSDAYCKPLADWLANIDIRMMYCQKPVLICVSNPLYVCIMTFKKMLRLIYNMWQWTQLVGVRYKKRICIECIETRLAASKCV